MQSSNIPAKFPTPFAQSGLKNTIPENGAPPNPNNATFLTGFPAITMEAIASGGLPPYGQDMNGILNVLTQMARWNNAGGQYTFDATFCNDTNVAGYPKGALLQKATLGGFWLNTTENNTNNPDTGGSGWVDLASILANLPVATSIGGTGGLRSQLKTGPGFCAVTGYYASGDGGGGLYYYDSTDVTSSDNGGTIIVATDGGRWKLALVGSVSVKQFGAKGDGSTIDTNAFANCIGAVLDIFIPAGTYILGPTVAWTGTLLYLGTNTGNPSRSGIRFRGAGQGNTTLKLANSAGTNVLLFGIGNTDTLTDATFTDFTIDLNGANNNINSIYNNAFYFYGKCARLRWERMGFKNMASQQTIRVGNETLAGYGDNIVVQGCTFDTFGIGGGWSTTDISVVYIQADNIKIIDNTFTNPSFTLNPSIGHTAIEVNGANSTTIHGNRFTYVQLPTLIDSFYQGHYNVSIQGNAYWQCNYIAAFDSGSTFPQSNISIKGNVWISTWNNSSSIIQIGVNGEASKTREDIVVDGNIVRGWGNSNQGLNFIYSNGTYIRSLFVKGNDVVGYNGSLVYITGAIQNTGFMDVTIQSNRMDSLGQSSGGPCFIDIEPSSGTINSLIVKDNEMFNTATNNYATKGAIKLSGAINYIDIHGNTGVSGIGTTYPLVVDSTTSWTTKVIESSLERPVNYRSGFITLAASSSQNLYDFTPFGNNDNAILDVDLWVNVGGTGGGTCISAKVLYSSSTKTVTVVSQGGSFAGNITLNFSGNILRVTSTYTSSLAALFNVRGLSTLPIAWLV